MSYASLNQIPYHSAQISKQISFNVHPKSLYVDVIQFLCPSVFTGTDSALLTFDISTFLPASVSGNWCVMQKCTFSHS